MNETISPHSNVMYSLIFFTLLLCNNVANGDEVSRGHNLTFNEIADTLVHVLRADKENDRIKELTSKLMKVSSYVVDNDKFEEILRNIARKNDLNDTNFYQALTENDHFRFLTVNDTKNLYLKLKEKMNRDDLIHILSKRGDDRKLRKSARKATGQDYLASEDLNPLHDVVDKIIAEEPNDNHKYYLNKNESIYWDPQSELEALDEFHKHDGRRLFKGERTTIRYYPFMVSVHVMGKFWCGGVLYWHDLVLTSASCLQLMHNNRFFRENPRVLQVRLGSNHSRIGGDTVDALEVYFNPGYEPRTLKNNIAVIRLRNHIFFNYHRIPKIIAISHDDHTPPPTSEVMLLGWGVTKMSQKLRYEPIFLQKKLLPVYPNEFCKEVYGEKFITQSMFCAGTFTTGEGACDHDAGGPAILAGRLVGVISFGPVTCGQPNAPTVFTLVGAFADWIETINETMPEYYRGRKRTTTTTKSPIFDYISTWRPKSTVTTSTLITPVEAPKTFVITPAPAGAETTIPDAGGGEVVEDTTSPTFRHQKDDSDGGWSIDLK